MSGTARGGAAGGGTAGGGTAGGGTAGGGTAGGGTAGGVGVATGRLSLLPSGVVAFSGCVVRAARGNEKNEVVGIANQAFESMQEPRDALFALRSKEGLVLIAEKEGRILGYAAAGKLAPGRWALFSVAIKTEARGQGVGTKLVLEIIERIMKSRCQPYGRRNDSRMGGGKARRKAKSHRLEILALGDPAFYGRFGFRKTGESGCDFAWAGPHCLKLDDARGADD